MVIYPPIAMAKFRIPKSFTTLELLTDRELLVCCAVLGGFIGNHRGSAVIGFALGFLLGPLGVLLAFTLRKPSAPCPYCKENVKLGAIVCPHCRHSVVLSPTVD